VSSKLYLELKAVMFATSRSAVRIFAAIGMIFAAYAIDAGRAAAGPTEQAYCGAPGFESLAAAPGTGRFGWIVNCLPTHGPSETRLVLSEPGSGERMVTIGLHSDVRMLGFDPSGQVYWASTQAKDTLQAASRRLTISTYSDSGQIREAAAFDLPFEAQIAEKIDVPNGWLIRLWSAAGRKPEQDLFLFYRSGEIKVASTATIGKLLWRAGPDAFLYIDRKDTLRAIGLDGHDAPEVAKTYAPALPMLEPGERYAGAFNGLVGVRVQESPDAHVWTASMITGPSILGATANAQPLATWRHDWLKTVTMSADGQKAAFAFSDRIEVLTSADGWKNARVLPYDDAFQSDIAFDASGTTLIAISQAVRRWSIAP
jgi:hypothetical protein